MPQQTYLDLAIWYSELNLNEESETVLETCPQKDNEILYWYAWIHRNDTDADKYLKEANNGNAYLVFPFRSETVPVMQWADKQLPDWKNQYYLALIYSFHEHRLKALQLLEEAKAPENFAPFYVLRARLRDSAEVRNIQSDLTNAQQIDKNDWRYGKYLTEFLLSQKQYKEASEVIEPYYKKDKGNYMAGSLYARCLMLNNDYLAAEKVFDHIHILPYEGAQAAHTYYVQTKLNLALQYLQKRKYKLATQKVNEAKLWPERLGAGAPYPDMVNHTFEDEIQQLINEAQQGKKLSDDTIKVYTDKVNLIGGPKSE